MWIVGNTTTLANSRSVWQKIVKDAMARGCLFDASDDKGLSNALVNAIVELDDSENLARMDALHISTPTFQVVYCKIVPSKITFSYSQLPDYLIYVMFFLVLFAEAWAEIPSIKVSRAAKCHLSFIKDFF